MRSRSTLCLVGMIDSIHFTKWLNETKKEFPEKNIILFPSDKPHLSKKYKAELRNKHKHLSIIHIPFAPWQVNYYLFAFLDHSVGIKWRSILLKVVILVKRPTIIHFHEMQHSAYIFNQVALNSCVDKKITKIITTWGSDLTLYGWSDKHKMQIQKCLKWADVMTAEKHDEEVEARRLGFQGKFIAPLYVHLGSSLRYKEKCSPPSSRKLIVVKGYQDNPGRALNALQLLLSMRDFISGYEVIVFSASEPVELQVDLLRNKEGLKIGVFTGTHQELIEVFMNSRIYIGLSESDGLPGAFIEAISVGCFPIQSGNSAANLFIKDGINGYVVNPWDFENLKSAFHEALSNDNLVNSGFEVSRKIISENYNLETGINELRKLYSMN